MTRTDQRRQLRTLRSRAAVYRHELATTCTTDAMRKCVREAIDTVEWQIEVLLKR
jgi:hypothetical protein